MDNENNGDPPCGRYQIFTEEQILEFRDIVKKIEQNIIPENITFFTGNFSDDKQVEALIKEYRRIAERAMSKDLSGYAAKLKTSGEIFPTDVTPVLLTGGEPGKMDAIPMKWGYPCTWNPKARPLINAQSETLTQLATFKDSALQRRCLIPIMGYYEWMHVEGQREKIKHYIVSCDGQLMYLAGIYKVFDGVPYYSILTRTPTQEISHIHGRMPLVIPRANVLQWLNCGTKPEQVNDFIRLLEMPAMFAVAMQPGLAESNRDEQLSL